MEIKKTISTIFMVPTLKIDKNKLIKNKFLNGYIIDSGREVQYEDSVYLLFKPEDLDVFREFLEEEYERTRSIIDDYNYEGGYVVVVYKLNQRFKRDFNLIREGKYSKTSVEFQEMFPKIVTIYQGNFSKDEITLHWRIFDRTQDMIDYWEDKLGVVFDKNMEVWHGFEIEKETLFIEQFKEILV